MKKFHKTFGWVTVTKKGRTSSDVVLESGEEKTILNKFLLKDESTPMKAEKVNYRAIAHTMSAEAVKEHIDDIDEADQLFWACWKVFKYEGKWSKSLKTSDFAVHFKK